jgi:hypothetical protein
MVSANMHRKDDERPHRQLFDHEKRGITIQAAGGATRQKISIVYGTVDTGRAGGVHGNQAESEDILTIVLPAKVFIDRVHSGEINDLKTLVAGYWFAKHCA